MKVHKVSHLHPARLLALWLTARTVWVLMVACRMVATLGTARIIRNILSSVTTLLRGGHCGPAGDKIATQPQAELSIVQAAAPQSGQHSYPQHSTEQYRARYTVLWAGASWSCQCRHWARGCER